MEALEKCPKCKFFLIDCMCKKYRTKKQKILDYLSWKYCNFSIHLNLKYEGFKTKYRVFKHSLYSKFKQVQRVKDPRDDIREIIPEFEFIKNLKEGFINLKGKYIDFQFDILEIEEFLKTCLFANDKTLVKKIFSKADLTNTSYPVKEQFEKLGIQYLWEFKNNISLKCQENDLNKPKLKSRKIEGIPNVL